MAVSVAFSYNGSTTVTAVVTGATNGHVYALVCDDPNFSAAVTGTASGGTVTLTDSTVGGLSAGQSFEVYVMDDPALTAGSEYYAATVVQYGTSGEFGFPAVWSFDGNQTVSVTFTGTLGTVYALQVTDVTAGGSTPSTITATGGSDVLTNIYGATIAGTDFFALLYLDGSSPFQSVSDRTFTQAVASAGNTGNPSTSSGGHTGHGVCVSFVDGSSVPTDALATSPLWVSIDDPAAIDVVTGWQVHRGRTYMTDRTEAGTASADFIDMAGTMDPTNSTGPFYPMDPNCPMKIEIQHPIDLDWHVIYTGLVQNIPTTMDVTERIARGTLNATDLFSLLAIDEIPPGLDFDSSNAGTNTANTVGETTYAAQTVQDRIKAILADAGIPSARTDIFTGNVDVQFTIYPPGTQTLTTLQDAADAEFPGVANLYCDKSNNIVFHGRKARSDPTGTASGTDWIFTTWNVGDHATLLAHPTYAIISGLSFDRDVAKIINASSISPDGIADADVPGQLSVSSGSITQYGNRVYTAANLITQAGHEMSPLNANAETKLYSDYFVGNFSDAQTRITQVTFQGVPAGAPYAEATWDIICGVDIGDAVNVTTTHPGSGGFTAAPYFVEGISYTATNTGGDKFLNVTMTLDLSPAAYFTTAPFS